MCGEPVFDFVLADFFREKAEFVPIDSIMLGSIVRGSDPHNEQFHHRCR